MPRTPKTVTPATTAQRLDSIVKSARRIMRKDKGLNGDLDRLPLLTWVLFLKFIDDMERVHEDEALLAGRQFQPAIVPPYRWRDWAGRPEGITGPDLIRFLTAEECIRPDGTKGLGLFTYLRGIRGRDGVRDRRDVIATVFTDMSNRMESGYILRDLLNLVNGIHFNASDEIHTLSRLYEGLLREMRDAAGDSGEFYTPRAVVRFMVAAINPRLGETVLDPACGTGGFLAEAFEHLAGQVVTTEDRQTLQTVSLLGIEAKRLPYLLAQMNLLLHGLEAPAITLANTLAMRRLTEIGESERVNIILTNPPFAGEEEVGIQANFPDDRRTTETALLFLQVIMRRLKRAGRGRAAVVVPNGTLFEGGVAARVKADLLTDFNLHTLVRLPEGVFAPYTDIPTNILFFDTTGPTRHIRCWQQPMPAGRRKYSKTAPLAFEEMADCLAWCGAGGQDARAWTVPVEGLVQTDAHKRVVAVNLDLKNPAAADTDDHRAPSAIIGGILEREQRMVDLLREIEELVADRA